MKKRMFALGLVILLLISASTSISGCDESQTDSYVTQILFGDSAQSRSSDENVKMLLSALYLCSEQTDSLGQEKLEYLKSKGVLWLPSFSNITIKQDDLLLCSHNSWEYIYTNKKKNQNYRKKVLQNTVNKVFAFGLVDNWLGITSDKCESFSALLYYSHILADYLADNPTETEAVVKGKEVSAYAGQAYIEINGNMPSFTSSEKKNTTSFVQFSQLDSLGRAGVAFANIGPDILDAVGARNSMTGIQPTGWSFNKYEGIVNSQPAYLYNRCHLLAHSLGGVEEMINLVTGTRYMNESGMKPFEDKVAKYIENSGNHVLYRATPIFKGDNKLCSGIQLEAYSIEDSGKGICFNVYCYNVQPGVHVNYVTGDNELSDITFGADNILPFAVNNPSDQNPDLIYEMNKHLLILFEDQKNTGIFNSLKTELDSIAINARNVGAKGETPAKCYIDLKQYEYKYMEALKTYVPILLSKEEFFNSTFK